MSWRDVLTLVLLVAAIVTGWSVWRQHERAPEAAGSGTRSEYVLHDFELVALDDEGVESFTLRSPEMSQTPGQRSMDMASPVFLLPDSERRYWTVAAKRGWVAPEGEELRLTGDVRVDGPPGDRKVVMETDRLNVYPQRDTAVAPGLVTITQPGSILRGRGLETNLASKRYELKSQVHSRYVPQ